MARPCGTSTGGRPTIGTGNRSGELKRDPVKQQLDALADARRDPHSPASQKLIAAALAAKISLAAAKAAKIAGEAGLENLAPALAEAFDRFFTAADKQCEAKIEIARALRSLEYPSADLFLRGTRHVQMEGSFGEPVDTAAELRGVCVLGLVDIGYPDALLEAVALLVDRWVPARVGAIRALGASGEPGAELVLRLKVFHGDKSTEVIGECFAELCQMRPERSIPFVAGYLDSPDREIAEAAALALGETRHAEAFDALRAKWERDITGFRRTLLVAIATLRQEAAFEFLLKLVADGKRRESEDAATALAIYRHDEALQLRVREAQAKRT